ncbi:MAG: OmpH family outer membrane protein [Bacteroidota bacterium]|nr:OmpH family outer membrane protein [Bacteroidota bacterium]
MKRYLLLIGFMVLAAGFSKQAIAQARIAYIDSEYILGQMPEYRSAQSQLDTLADSWKREIERRAAEIDKLFKAYQAEFVLLPEPERKKREEEISRKEKELNEYKREKFGPDGELFRKRQQLIKPIQDKIYDAVQQMAKENGLDIVFDKAGAVTMMFADSKYDRSDEVLDILGVTEIKNDE